MNVKFFLAILVTASIGLAAPPRAVAGGQEKQGGTPAGRQGSVATRPDTAEAHHKLGLALYAKGDRDGAIREYREAVRLWPDLAEPHCNLGVAREQKGDRQGALEEYRAAYKLERTNSTFRDNYERLSRELKK